jgi:hypothetical protein
MPCLTYRDLGSAQHILQSEKIMYQWNRKKQYELLIKENL